ncbi:MFS transporter [Streptomyces sp. NPDC005925]|uniref:MFS transporter n=1 Tax=Streptomyces sp. NPDC005925 TaxID=3157172 RepID=UPI0033CBE365
MTDLAKPAPPAGPRERTLTLIVVCSALFLSLLDSTVVVLALPTVGRDLGTDLTGLQWVVEGYVCAYAALLLTGGYLGDRWGRRRVFLIGMGLFTAGSLLCAAAGSVEVLAAGRAVQGIGAAAVTPQTLALLSQAFPGEGERAKALSTWSAVSGLALVLGPVAGGSFAEAFGWRSVFLLNVPVGLFALAAGRRLPAPLPGPRRPLDRLGHILIVACLASATYGLVEGPRSGWSAPDVAAALVLAAAAALALLTRERRTAHPALRLDFFRIPVFAGATGVMFLMAVALNAAYLVLSLLLQVVEGVSPAESGTRLLPTMTAIVIGAFLAGRAGRRLKPWQLVATGTALAGASLLFIACLTAGHSYAVWWPGAALMGLGMGLVMSPNNGLMIGGVRPEDTGQAAAMGGALQQVGAMLGIASLGAVLGPSALDGHALTATADLGAGLRNGLILAGVSCLLATTVTVLLTRAGRERPAAPTAPPPEHAGNAPGT